MKVYVSGRVLRAGISGGIVSYFHGVTEALLHQAQPGDEWHLGLSGDSGASRASWPDAARIHPLTETDRAAQADVERALIDDLKPDWVIYFVADPLNYYGQGQFGVTCCFADLQHLHLPFFFPPADRVARDDGFARAVEHCDFLFTLSDFCRNDIVARYRLPLESVHVIRPALHSNFTKGPAEPDAVANCRQRFGLPVNYAIYPANLWPHKNHARLLNCFADWHRESKSSDGHLVLVGSLDGGDISLRKQLRAAGRAGWLSTSGFVTDDELHALTSGARCLVFPSLFEGFGIPVLEALATGRPVASSNASSLMEVGGAFPHYFDPSDEGKMLRAIKAAWGQVVDTAYQQTARAYAARFSYADSARQLRRALDGGRAALAPRGRAQVQFVDEPPLVSIVTPSFQQGRFLRQCIESVLQQDYPRVEYMVFDGGSSDGTIEVLRSFGDRFQWQSGPDGGQTSAINLGLRRARGEILAYLNSDDFLLPGAIGAVVESWRQQPSVDLMYGKAHWTDEAGNVTRPYLTGPFNAERLRGDCFICQPACFWRRRVIEQFGLFDERFQFAMDYEFWQRVVAGGGVVSFLDQFLACSRRHEATKTLSQRGRVFRDIFASQWKTWGKVHEDWWLALLHHLADERKGFWAQLIPSRSRTRGRVARGLSRLLRRPTSRPTGRSTLKLQSTC